MIAFYRIVLWWRIHPSCWMNVLSPGITLTCSLLPSARVFSNWSIVYTLQWWNLFLRSLNLLSQMFLVCPIIKNIIPTLWNTFRSIKYWPNLNTILFLFWPAQLSKISDNYFAGPWLFERSISSSSFNFLNIRLHTLFPPHFSSPSW